MIAASSKQPPRHETPNRRYHNAQAEHLPGGTDEQIAIYTGWLAIFTAILAVTAGLEIALLISAAKTANATAEATNKLATAAIAQHGVMQAQMDVTKAMQRASLGVEPGGVSTFIPRRGTPQETRGDQIVAHIGITNAGHLPAHHVEWAFDADFSKEERRTSFPHDGLERYGNNSIPPGITSWQGAKALPTSAIGECQYLYVWGKVTYEDGFEVKRHTNFCHRYNLDRLNPDGPTGERIEKKFGRYYERHNDAT